MPEDENCWFLETLQKDSFNYPYCNIICHILYNVNEKVYHKVAVELHSEPNYRQ